MLSQKMSIEDKILELLNQPRFRYKGISTNIFGLPIFSEYKKQSLYNALFRLHEKSYIEKDVDRIKIASRGQKYVQERASRHMIFESPFSDNAPKNLLVIFDIPEDRKGEREWFRFQLRQFGYEMIQRSVWVGPSPLPAEFKNYVKSIGLKSCIKTFKLAKSYNFLG